MDLAPQVKPTMVNHPRWRMKQFRFEKCKYHQDVPMLCIYGNWSTKPMRTPFVEYSFHRPILSIFLPPILLLNCKFPNDSDKCLKSYLIIRGTFWNVWNMEDSTERSSGHVLPTGHCYAPAKVQYLAILAISLLGRKILCQCSQLVTIFKK